MFIGLIWVVGCVIGSESTATDLSSIIAFSVVGGFFGIAIGVIIYIILRRYFGGQAAVLAARPSAGWSRVSAVPNRNQVSLYFFVLSLYSGLRGRN